jgi:transcriptional regulator with XRE-family HTH domain
MAAPIQNVFGAVIRRRRKEAGLSQEALAHQAHLHRNYIGLLERGLRTPSIEVVRKLAIGLGTSMTVLVEELEVALAAKPNARRAPGERDK